MTARSDRDRLGRPAACSPAAEIARSFGGPVGAATPTYPYCQWLVGRNSFLALEVLPHIGFATATEYVSTLQSVTGLGVQAEIANNRYLYFSQAGTSYWLLFQTPGDFSSLHAAQLAALGRDVLTHAGSAGDAADSGPARRPGSVRPTRAGPPIYFAGDSTAAGPEWAWWAFHENRSTTRTLAEYQVGTGLVANGFFDWQRHLLAVTAARRPRLVIFMDGANDAQAMIVGGQVRDVGSARWDAAYAGRVAATMRGLVHEGAKVLWIGEPAMQDPALSASMRVIDQIDAAAAAREHGVVYFDPGSVLDGPGGSYAGSLEVNGQLTPVRLDGIHLNQAGSVLLADAIAREVARILHVKVPG